MPTANYLKIPDLMTALVTDINKTKVDTIAHAAEIHARFEQIHPFSDGNKRIASLLFLYFLEKNEVLSKENGERKINDNTILTLALLIANSDPKEKEVMVGIITSLLKE